MITIIADEGKHKVGTALYQRFISQGVGADYINLDKIEVKPCYNCDGCKYKSYGKCVVRDDADRIYPKIIRCDALVLVTPVVFGGYSFKAKRVLDKLGLVMDWCYHVKDKELVKGGLPGKQFRYFGVGVSENGDSGEADSFKRHIRETILITQGAGRAFVTGPEISQEELDQIVVEVMGA
jgi:multimeric flavodoxin WrbA